MAMRKLFVILAFTTCLAALSLFMAALQSDIYVREHPQLVERLMRAGSPANIERVCRDYRAPFFMQHLSWFQLASIVTEIIFAVFFAIGLRKSEVSKTWIRIGAVVLVTVPVVFLAITIWDPDYFFSICSWNLAS